MRGFPVTFRSFSGGLNTQDSVYEIAPNEARDALNVVASPKGAIRKRNGCAQFNVTALTVPMHSLFAMRNPDCLLAAGGTSWYRIDPTGAVTTYAAGLVTANQRWEWAQGTAVGGQGPVYGLNGVDAPRWFSGSATGAWTGVPATAKFPVWLNNRMWVAVGSRLQWSDVLNPTVWPAANYVDLDADDGELLTGIGTVGPYLLAFKRNKAWVIYDLDAGDNRRLAAGVGCVAHRSIVESPAGTFFLSGDQGVMRTDGSSVVRASDKITMSLARVAAGSLAFAAGAFFDNRYYLAASEQGAGNDVVYDLDVQQGGWWRHSNRAEDFAVLPIGGVPALLAAPSGANRVEWAYKPGEALDAGATFAAFWRGPFHAFDAPYLRKRLREMHFDGFGQVDVSLSRDFLPAEGLVRSVTFPGFGAEGQYGVDLGSYGVDDGQPFGAVSTVSEQRIFSQGVARSWSAVFGNASASPFTIESYTMAVTARKS